MLSNLINKKTIQKITGISIFLLCLVACGNDVKMEKADYIFTNGKVYTVENDNPWAEAVVIKNDEIIFVGNSEEAKKYSGPATILHDLDGRFMLPGFIDSHAHAVLGGGYVNTLSLDSYAQPDDWLKAVGEYAAENKDLPLIFGYGFLASAYGDKGPTKEMLDAVVPDRPVFIMDEGFHSGWANTLAMEKLEITKDTLDPTPGFNFYKRDEQGNPTGWFLEGTAAAAMDKLDVITQQSVMDGTIDVFNIMNSYGITAVYDAGFFESDAVGMGVLERLDEDDKFSVRLVGSQLVADPDQIDGALDKLELLVQKTASKKYHINVLKIMGDGTVEARTAGMYEDYQNDPGNNGATVFTQKEITDLVVDAAGRQLDVHIHALGERTIDEALNAIEEARKIHGDSESRYTLCHIQLMTPEAVIRFAELDVIAQGTPLWASYDIEGKKFVSDDQFNRYYPYNSLKNLGVRLAFGSDFPSTGAGTLGLSPIFNIEIGHTRQFAGQPDALIQPPVSERLDVASLIRGYTYDAAYQLHMEDEIGSIKIGKKADFVILNNNPFEADPYEIHKIEVDMTMKGGQIVYEK